MFQTIDYQIRSKRIPIEFDGYTIVHLSDLHGQEYGPKGEILVSSAAAQRPDLIVMTGDMAGPNEKSFASLFSLSQGLVKLCPVYYIVGNHEQILPGKARKHLYNGLSKCGVKCLKNEHVRLSRKSAEILLYGMCFHMRYYRDRLHQYDPRAHFTSADLKMLVGSVDQKHYSILLAHNPIYFPSYQKWGADLVLSGHMHGGLVRLPGIGGVLSPEMTFFPKYDGGLYELAGSVLEVSRGLKESILRIGNPAEYSVLTLYHRGN